MSTAQRTAVGLAILFLAGNLGGCPSTIQMPDVNLGQVNTPPEADAGPDKSAVTGDQVQLDGMRSSDPDGDALRYLWEQIYGPAVQLENANQRVANFSPTLPGDYEFSLTVSDSADVNDTDTMVVSVASRPDSSASEPVPAENVADETPSGDAGDVDAPAGDDGTQGDDVESELSGEGVLAEILCQRAIIANVGGVDLVFHDLFGNFTLWKAGDPLSIAPNVEYGSLIDVTNTSMNSTMTLGTYGQLFERGTVTAIDSQQQWVEVAGRVWEVAMSDDLNGWNLGDAAVIVHNVEDDMWYGVNLELCAYSLLFP